MWPLKQKGISCHQIFMAMLEAYLEPSESSKMKLFVKKVCFNSCWAFLDHILGVWLDSEHTSGCVLLKSAEFSQIDWAKTLVELLILLYTLMHLIQKIDFFLLHRFGL